MLTRIAVLFGLYVIARLVPDVPRWLGLVTRSLAILAAALILADAGLRVAHEGGVLGLLGNKPDVAQESAVEQRPKPSATVTYADGGSITTNLGYGIAVSKDSSLTRKWIAVHDEEAIPVALVGTPGVTTVYEREGYSGEYRYRSTYRITPRVPVQAIGVRFLIFNVWGEFVRALDAENVEDLEADVEREFTSSWRSLSENEVGQHYASIAFITRVRQKDGRVVEAPLDVVVQEAKKLSEQFSREQLDVPPPTPSPKV